MMRIGFTIIYNGAHHLQHNGWGWRLPGMVDRWVIVEGAAQPNGSTYWCNKLDAITSDDGTVELLNEIILKNLNTCLIKPDRGWRSKDEMVNVAIDLVIRKLGSGARFLWQFDCDEQWTEKQLDKAEKELTAKNGTCGCFHANHYVGKNLVAKGTWGEGNDPSDQLANAYRRLWIWRGQKFQSHEPPKLIGGNGNEILLSQRFNHFSYYFEKDVIFKSRYYKSYESLHKNWLNLQKMPNFPQPINRLIGGYWGESKTVIYKKGERA